MNTFENPPEQTPALEKKPYPAEQVALSDKKVENIASELKHAYHKKFELTENAEEYILRTPEPDGTEAIINISKKDPDIKGVLWVKVMSPLSSNEYTGSQLMEDGGI